MHDCMKEIDTLVDLQWELADSTLLFENCNWMGTTLQISLCWLCRHTSQSPPSHCHPSSPLFTHVGMWAKWDSCFCGPFGEARCDITRIGLVCTIWTDPDSNDRRRKAGRGRTHVIRDVPLTMKMFEKYIRGQITSAISVQTQTPRRNWIHICWDMSLVSWKYVWDNKNTLLCVNLGPPEFSYFDPTFPDMMTEVSPLNRCYRFTAYSKVYVASHWRNHSG